MPAEWEPHRATWLAWPHNMETWPEQLDAVKETWVKMVQTISTAEEVCLLVNDEGAEREAMSRLSHAQVVMDHVSVYRIPTVDTWIRDYGPTFITKKKGKHKLAFNNWVFNAWGQKYKSYLQDDSVAGEIAQHFHTRVFDSELVLEGGSIDVNGCGTCLTTEQCLLNPNRNPHLAQNEIEAVLMDALGMDHLIWLDKGLVGDDTDGHVDDIARFVNPTTVVCAVENNSGDENYAPLQENYERLQAATDQNGNKLTLVPLPLPGPVFYRSERLPASYTNFYIANQVVLVPTYGDLNDRIALGILKTLFSQREVLGVPCNDVVVGLGAIHCITQQEPCP
ncbi:MAG: agmatine/peptidylarginine deiminase [Candidatus Binatia bacterium]